MRSDGLAGEGHLADPGLGLEHLAQRRDRVGVGVHGLDLERRRQDVRRVTLSSSAGSSAKSSWNSAKRAVLVAELDLADLRVVVQLGADGVDLGVGGVGVHEDDELDAALELLLGVLRRPRPIR